MDIVNGLTGAALVATVGGVFRDKFVEGFDVLKAASFSNRALSDDFCDAFHDMIKTGDIKTFFNSQDSAYLYKTELFVNHKNVTTKKRVAVEYQARWTTRIGYYKGFMFQYYTEYDARVVRLVYFKPMAVFAKPFFNEIQRRHTSFDIDFSDHGAGEIIQLTYTPQQQEQPNSPSIANNAKDNGSALRAAWLHQLSGQYSVNNNYVKVMNNMSMAREVSRSTYSPSKAAQAVINEVKKWYACGEFYENQNIPWRTGILLFGPPGNGKTSFIRHLARELRTKVFVVDLASCRKNADFAELMVKAEGNKVKILVFEDFDSVFNGRENLTATNNETGVTFDCLLNYIDGVKSKTGTITIISTNKPEMMDEALIRPGRVDYRLELLPPTHEEKIQIAKNILSFCGREVVDQIMAGAVEGESAAAFERKCLSIAEIEYRKCLE